MTLFSQHRGSTKSQIDTHVLQCKDQAVLRPAKLVRDITTLSKLKLYFN